MKRYHIYLYGVLLFAGMAVAEEPEPRAYGRFVPERKDDFAWENDKVAFRAYGPGARDSAENSGFDCWLKRVEYPIIDKWYGQRKTHSYHKDWGEGHDPYHTGASRGCGGLGLWIDEKLITSETFTEWEMVRCEAQEVEFLLRYAWSVGEDHYTEEKRIRLRMGERLFHVTSTFWKNEVLAPDLPIAIGLTTHDGKADLFKNAGEGWMACWETIDGHGLGTGVVIDPKRILEIREVRSEQKDESHGLILARTDAQGQVAYQSGYGWTKAGEIKDRAAWSAYLSEQGAAVEAVEDTPQKVVAP